MPLTFDEAYAIVCPDGRTVDPYSKDFTDIKELMRQSGHVSFQDRLVRENVPRVPKTAVEALPYHVQRTIEPAGVKISKQQWLSVDANRKKFLEALNKK